MAVLVTGVAGFIGSQVALALLARGEEVVGIDNLNDYYDVSLKEARLARLQGREGFSFFRLDIADQEAMFALAETKLVQLGVTKIIHLAAQAGVRYSLTNPMAYIQTNVVGQTVMMEIARRLPGFEHFVYASSSSVYGGNTKVPFAETDPVERPVSLYAATKRMDELMAYTYAHLFEVRATGLRFFTVYGPWGRPDMALFLFTKKILADEPIPVFNNGQMRRDFTYIDDIVTGTLAALDHPPALSQDAPPAQIFNLGNSHTEELMTYVHTLEEALGKKAEIEFLPLQPGDVPATFADLERSAALLGFKPKTHIKEGISKFVAWYRDYYKV